MPNSNPLFRRTLLSVAVAAALGTAAPAAHAITIQARADWGLDGAPAGTNSDVAGPQGAGTVDVLDSDASPTSDVFYHVFGNASGSFGSRVSGSGTFDIVGEFSFEDTITNNSGGDQAYNLNFNVVPGELSIFGQTVAGDMAFASYSLEIFVDGMSVWDSAAEMTLAGTQNAAFMETGSTSLGGILSTGADFTRYAWGPFSDSASLGTFGDGVSFDVSYVLRTTATGMFGPDCLGGGGEGGEGGEGGFAVALNGGAPCRVTARIGDPNNIQTNPSTASINAVPEPGTLALLGLGLLGAGSLRRRSKS